MNYQSKPLSKVIEEALTACENWEIVLLNFDRPTLESPAFLRYKGSEIEFGTVMLSVESLQDHYRNRFKKPETHRAIVIDEAETEIWHKIGLVGDDWEDDGSGDDFIETDWEEKISEETCETPTEAELNYWKISILSLMQKRFEMLEEATSKN